MTGMGKRARSGMRGFVLSAALVGVFVPASAQAAGWDTPIVFTARHQGMGGTAIAAVDDPSASFHNPAGYSGVQGLEALGSFSLLLGRLRSSPDDHPEATSIQSDLVVAPFPLGGLGYRVHDWVSVGFGAYPVASGAASYEYDNSTGGRTRDSLRAVYFEFAPGVSINVPESVLPGALALGVSYRATMVSFQRNKESLGADLKQLDLDLKGWNFGGVRIGLQYSPIPQLRLGAVVRNKIEVAATGEEGVAVLPFTDVELGFVLPLKAGFGARFDAGDVGVALDYEFTKQSQNGIVQLSGVGPGDLEQEVDNHFVWSDGHTIRAGLEYRLTNTSRTIPLRAGYVFDGTVGNPLYPTAFGTPAAPTHSFTLGTGYERENFEVNLAGAYRAGSTTITEVDSACALCGHPGDYSLTIFGAYLDASYRFDL